MNHITHIRLREAADLCGVRAETLSGWLREDGFTVQALAQGSAVSCKDLRRSLLNRGLPVPDGLDSAIRILVVDDEPDMRTMIRAALRGVWPGAHIRTAVDGIEARRKLDSLRPHLLVTDIMLPDFSGVLLCQHVQDNGDLCGTKVIAITGFHSPEVNRTVLGCGADEYLTKPFTPQQLRQSAIRLIGLLAGDRASLISA